MDFGFPWPKQSSDQTLKTWAGSSNVKVCSTGNTSLVKFFPLTSYVNSPTNVHIMTERRVVEGANASLTCMSNSNPPPSAYQWIITQKSSTTKHNGQSFSLQDVRRDTSVVCTAQNSFGRGQSDPLVLNVHFPPTILLDSGCWDRAGGMRCVCRAEADPRPSISWMVNGSIDLFPQFHTSANYTERVTVSELTGPLTHNVSCVASNYLGKNSYQIPTHQPLSGGITVAIVAAVVIVIIVIAVIIIYWRKRSHKKTSGNSTKQLKTDDLDLNACSFVNETVEVDLYVNTPQTKKDDGCNAYETM
ncbi:BDNF/NT-3 growth factors receptor-like isoform X1 [Astyanax mexicanus]|uniref:BDNF/NT-3 growth factors receptor-like isoform X1 n=1 Tax=Astyanax mexicanus TaxID=7994 RepID=A0A8T2MKV0_ASTMX|nr:BDNF/NT-3 growth factors receptor-like isoform X1 [Astyanax mexicanus]